jgi:rhodanese-related sulfurtransferase
MKHSPGFLQMVEQARAQIQELSAEQTLARLQAGSGLILVDVREDREWQAGHAAGALHLGKGIIERDIEAAVPDLDAELVLYCGGGYRSALAALALQQMGYRRIWSMAGGWKAWVALGAPTTSP